MHFYPCFDWSNFIIELHTQEKTTFLTMFTHVLQNYLYNFFINCGLKRQTSRELCQNLVSKIAEENLDSAKSNKLWPEIVYCISKMYWKNVILPIKTQKAFESMHFNGETVQMLTERLKNDSCCPFHLVLKHLKEVFASFQFDTICMLHGYNLNDTFNVKVTHDICPDDFLNFWLP